MKSSLKNINPAVELNSRFDGLSDKSLEIVRDMVRADNVEKLNELLGRLDDAMK